MARFYAEIQGNRGKASRMGTPNSGMWCHIRGWNVGVEVRCLVDANGKDYIDIYRTGGSSNGSSAKRIYTVHEDVEC